MIYQLYTGFIQEYKKYQLFIRMINMSFRFLSSRGFIESLWSIDRVKDDFDLFHCNGVSESRLSFSNISAVFERVEVLLHDNTINYLKVCKANYISSKKPAYIKSGFKRSNKFS